MKRKNKKEESLPKKTFTLETDANVTVFICKKWNVGMSRIKRDKDDTRPPCVHAHK